MTHPIPSSNINTPSIKGHATIFLPASPNLNPTPTLILATMIDPSETVPQSESLHLSAQTIHRINLINFFEIQPGSRILELGCGQGNCTEILAPAVGPNGHVDAVDPAPLDYGSPETLGQAQERLKKSKIGDQITFIQAEPVEFLGEAEGEAYDAVVLCHCLWYFDSKEAVYRTLEKAKGKAKRLLIAEWALTSSFPNAQPHILAALTRGACEAHIPDSDANIRSPFSSPAIKELAKEAGWKMVKEDIVKPGEGLEDAEWEIDMIDGEFLKRAKERISNEKVVTLLSCMQEALQGSVREVEGRGEKVRCMDVWVGSFE